MSYAGEYDPNDPTDPHARMMNPGLVRPVKARAVPQLPLPPATAPVIDQVKAILSPDWARGRVLPRMVGSEDIARVEALRKLLGVSGA